MASGVADFTNGIFCRCLLLLENRRCISQGCWILVHQRKCTALVICCFIGRQEQQFCFIEKEIDLLGVKWLHHREHAGQPFQELDLYKRKSECCKLHQTFILVTNQIRKICPLHPTCTFSLATILVLVFTQQDLKISLNS